MPWGGARIGSGRKPKRRNALRLVATADPSTPQSSAVPAAPTAPVDASLANPPGELPADQGVFWRDYAPKALERGTLIESALPGFRLLCELAAKKATAEQKAAGFGVSEMRLYLELAKRVEASLARFELTGFGKPARPTAAPIVADADDAFFGDTSGRRG